MKKSLFVLLFLGVSWATALKGQDTVRVDVLGKNMVTVVDGKGHNTDVKIGNNAINIRDGKDDSVKVRIGRRAMIITDARHNSVIRFKRLNNLEYEAWTGHAAKFRGHWAGFEMGINSFTNIDYKGSTPNFMDLNHNKSCEVGINFLQYDFGLQRDLTNIGLVTGLGLTLNDYRFSNPNTIENHDGLVRPVDLDPNKLSKSKLSTAYLSLPVMVEFQVPSAGHDKGFYVSAGVIGGLKLGSHTKVKYPGDKSKNHDDFNINPFRFGTTARIGYRGINLYGTYYFSQFFRDNRGPDMNPFTIGICLMNW